MNVKQLIEQLQKCNPDKVVVLTDPEGKGWDNIGAVVENVSTVKILMDGKGIFQESYSILSPNDGQLLIRFHDECVKAGMKSDKFWNADNNPNLLNKYAASEGRKVYYYCLYTGLKSGLRYHNHDCSCAVSDDPEPINLTPENFDEVLKKVIENS
jgi:hypothetical protein